MSAKLRNLDLKPYPIEVPDEAVTEEPVCSVCKKRFKPDPPIYYPKQRLRVLLTSPALGLNGLELIRNSDLSEKIKAAGDHVLLEDAEYGILAAAIRNLKGFGAADDIMMRRINNCPEEPVEVVKK